MTVTLNLAHAPAWLSWIIYALATFRATRLVTTDTITAPLRERVRRVGYVEQVRYDMAGKEVDRRTNEREGRRGRAGRWAFELVTCSWCSGIWVGALVVGLGAAFPRETGYVALALCFGAVVGLIAEWSR